MLKRLAFAASAIYINWKSNVKYYSFTKTVIQTTKKKLKYSLGVLQIGLTQKGVREQELKSEQYWYLHFRFSLQSDRNKYRGWFIWLSSCICLRLTDFRSECFSTLKIDARSQSDGCNCRYLKVKLNSTHCFKTTAKIPPQNTTLPLSKRNCRKILWTRRIYLRR